VHALAIEGARLLVERALGQGQHERRPAVGRLAARLLAYEAAEGAQLHPVRLGHRLVRARARARARVRVRVRVSMSVGVSVRVRVRVHRLGQQAVGRVSPADAAYKEPFRGLRAQRVRTHTRHTSHTSHTAGTVCGSGAHEAELLQ